MAFLYVKNEQDAMDIYQETVLKAYLNITKLKDRKAFKTWITKILVNNVYTKNNQAKKVQENHIKLDTKEFNNYKVKNKMVYDNVTSENIYKIGYHDTNEFLTIKFKNFKNKKDSEVTEFKVNISNYK